jgi:hypothetical protein
MKNKLNFSLPHSRLKWLWIFAGTLLFNFIFWKEGLGINLLIFTVFIMAGIAFLTTEAEVYPLQSFIFTGTVIGGFSVIYFHTIPSKILLMVSLLLFFALTGKFRFKTLIYPLFLSLREIFASPAKFREETLSLDLQKIYFYKTARFFRLLVVPLLILLFYLLFYIWGNPEFEAAFSSAYTEVFQYISRIFNEYPVSRLVLIALAFLFLTGIFIRKNYHIPWVREQSHKEVLNRARKSKKNNCSDSPLALKDAKIKGIITFLMLSLLLVWVLYTDAVTFLYPSKNYFYSSAVHTGVYILSFSIIISIVLVLIFFARNLNFYDRNNFLKTAATIWLVMNLLLVISTVWKNYIYIDTYGLTHKRIGVFIFLLFISSIILLAGIKVWKKKTLFYLTKISVFTGYIILLLLSINNWDILIARHNLTRDAGIQPDLEYILSLSDKAIPVMLEHQENFRQRMFTPGISNTYHEPAYNTLLVEKINNFFQKKNSQSAFSWNYAEMQTIEEIKGYSEKTSLRREGKRISQP